MKFKKRILCAFTAVITACSILLSGCGKTESDITSGKTATTGTSSVAITTEGTKATTGTTATQATTVIVIEPSKTTVLNDDQLLDKLLGGWIGEMVGVSWCGSTEFDYKGQIMPEDHIDDWDKDMINNAFSQDDLYAEIPFIEAMIENGYDCDGKCLAEKFRDSTFQLWHANLAGRNNLQAGIEYPYSGHYLFNDHADDIDWQIECDFLGMMYPGLINEAAARAFELGHITNYGDGVYGGVFIATMHAAAYTASSVEEIVYTGLSVIPDDTTFKECLNEVIKGYEEGKTWEEVWQTLQAKYGDGDRCIEMTEGTKLEAYNIDAKLNSAYTAIGLLWGEGDFEKTTTIACRCGQDSDCNASSAASVLGNFIGAENIPEKYKIGLDRNGTVFSNTKYTFDDAFDANYELMMAVLEDSENVSIKGADYSIDFYEVQTVPYEQWPTTFYVKPVIKAAGNKAVRCSFEARYGEIASAKMDMGDGFSADEVIAYYVYDEAGEYTVKCTFTSTDGEIFEFEQKIIISNEFTVTSKPICSMTPNGSGGNSNLAILVDGVKPAVGANAQKSQFDTYNKNQKPTQPIYIGVEFDVSATVAGIEFTEGMHFNDGGWFESTPAVEVLVDGKWTEVKATVSPDYPEGSTKDAHGDSFETYTFTLETPVENCKGIRISGVAGGSARFISAAELKPIVTAVSGDSSNLRSIIICNETNPQGGGNKSLGVIADGVTAAASSSQQYDTYAGETPEREIFVGYLFKNTQKISKVIYSEGMHFKDGGWFADDIIVEAKIDGKWVEVDASVSPVYLKGSDKAQAQGKTYTFTLKAPVDCSGIRIVGIAGGTAGFISISELDFQ